MWVALIVLTVAFFVLIVIGTGKAIIDEFHPDRHYQLRRLEPYNKKDYLAVVRDRDRTYTCVGVVLYTSVTWRHYPEGDRCSTVLSLWLNEQLRAKQTREEWRKQEDLNP